MTIEAQFAVAAITSDITQFNTVVAAIESSVIADVSDAVLHPPETGSYANLKACIIERYSESEQRKIQRLLSEVELGDRRPTQLLTELTALAKDKVSDEFLKSLWLKRLPPQVRAILQTSNVALAELAKLADRICEAGDFQQIAVASASDCPAYSDNAVILRRLEQIEQRLSRLDLRRSESVQSRSSSRRRRRTRSRPGSHPDWCWYHERFGDRANACRQPCKRPNELTNYETTNLQPPQNNLPAYHQLPADLSEESIRKEAALVLKQAESHQSKAENGDNIPTFKVKTKRNSSSSINTTKDTNPKKFHSLPTRKKKAPTKPVARSSSDAAAKKSAKRPSIFNIFSRKSDTNVNQSERDPRFEDSGGRRLVRSKSDVGSYNRGERKLKKALKDSKPTHNGSTKLLPTQLSPIIENTQREDYFAEQFNRERRKSDAITDREKYESAIEELLHRSEVKAEVDGNILGKNPISAGIKDKILTLQSKSNENMHSSQLPAQKLPLTKGVTVNGMVKRLSMERFSPPPTISGPAFSYIRPNEGITYAQLDLNDEHQQNTLQRKERLLSPTREIRTPVREYRSPARDIRSQERDFRSNTNNSNYNRNSVDRTEFVTSHNNSKQNSSSRVIIESPARTRNSFSPIAGPTTIRISSSHSPSPWQQLSPRNLSDEDEGLGIETRKYYDDETLKTRSKSPAEPPIVPVIRSITPTRENSYENQPYRSPYRDEPADDLRYRRARLESRILTRRFGDIGTPERTIDHQPRSNGYHYSNSPERNRDLLQSQTTHHRYLSPDREPYEPRFHKPASDEILQKYSPERSHLDIISPTTKTTTTLMNTLPKMEKTSRYKHTKYYDDGRGGVKDVYERETHLDADGKPHVRESRHQERLDSFTGQRDQSSLEGQQLTDYEPKSLDSQFTSTDQYRSSPENMKRYEMSMERNLPRQQHSSEDHWHSSLKRDKMQQRSFDKGDSGIENDFRKESFNGDLTTRWRKRTVVDDMKACEMFLKKERRHTEQQHVTRRKDNYVYRERSIDDGSHYDPHLDKYPVATSTLRHKDQHSQTVQGQETLKRNKKLGGFEKVKQLFTGGSGGGGGSGGSSGGSNTSKKESERHVRANSSTTSSGAQATSKDKDKDKDKYMVKEEEMRLRYREHRGAMQNEAMREQKVSE
ncbi:uncharacterized protein LOC119674908 [Teleopsis dalmanni]|uniref:uncharacterized protein LOC119674908 n=1 Tax=Teleopsis dalmanni TaxID=139649 RepID=UPI0018CE273B|nr:uncharacterized protein LOC119674908 [Teleopsis dalmanni]